MSFINRNINIFSRVVFREVFGQESANESQDAGGFQKAVERQLDSIVHYDDFLYGVTSLDLVLLKKTYPIDITTIVN